MKKIIIIVLSITNSLSISCCNDDYKTYCSEINAKLKAELSIPDEQVEFSTSTPTHVFTFGERYNGIAGLPVFIGKAVVRLSDQDKVVIMDLKRIKSDTSNSNGKREWYHIPEVSTWMLNNCGAPWALWYITNTGGVITEDNIRLSEEEQASLKDTVADLRAKHERVIKNTSLTKKTNCDQIIITAIPNIDKINVNKFDPNLPESAIMDELKKNCIKCYGVEFYKQSAKTTLQMLFFVGENNTIEENLTKMAKYIKFK